MWWMKMRSPIRNRKLISRVSSYLCVDTYRDSFGGPMSHDLNPSVIITQKKKRLPVGAFGSVPIVEPLLRSGAAEQPAGSVPEVDCHIVCRSLLPDRDKRAEGVHVCHA